MASTSPSQAPSNINTYYENWLIQLQNFLEKLNAISNSYDDDENMSELLSQILDHYQDYHREIFMSSSRDVFVLLSPPWYTCLEKTFLWMAGFKPTTLFSTIDYSIGTELTTEQGEELKRLKALTKTEEKLIEKGMAKVQESVAAPPIFELMKRGETVIDGEASDVGSVIDELKLSMMSMIETAEHLRESTVRKILGILRQKQAVKLMAAVAHFHLQARKLGLQMEIRSAKKINEDFIN